MVAVPATTLFISEAPDGPSPGVPLLVFAFVVLYVFFRGGAVQWVRSPLLRTSDASEDRPGDRYRRRDRRDGPG
jgi:hypothetical protein